MYPIMHTNISSTITTTQPLTQSNVAPVQNQTTITQATVTPSQQSSNESLAKTSTNTNNNSQHVASVDNSATKQSSNSNQQVASVSGTGKHTKHKHPATKPDSTATAYDYVRPSSGKSTKRRVHYTQPEENSVAPPKVSDNNTASQPIARNGTNPAVNSAQPTEVNKTAEQNNNNITIVKDTTNKTQMAVATTDSTKKHDSTTTTSTVVTSNQQQPAQTSKYTHTLFSVDAGAGYSLGWMKAGATQGSGFSPVLGISVTHYFSTNISALIGLQYNSLTNVNTLYSSTSAQYDFGAVSDVTSVTLKTLYYVALPIKFQYSLNSNSMVSGGVNILYLLNSNSNVVSYNQNYFGTSGYTSTDKMGYMDGLNNLDAQVTLAYRRKIQRFTVSAEGYYGLLDIENNSFFNTNVFERNSGLRIMLSYDIIK